MSRLCFAVLLLLITISAFSQTPRVVKSDTSQESFVCERMKTVVRFEDDGTGLRDTTAAIRVQSQAGVQALGQLVFGYSTATESLDVPYVRVRKPDGRVVETPASTAQDFAPEVLSRAPAYSDYRQRHISVADLQPGDVLEYQTRVHVNTALASHEFWYEHSFQKNVAVQEERLEVDIPKSRTVKLKSPEKKYEMHESGDRKIYSWTVLNFVPDRRSDADEEPIDFDYAPDVQMSTFADWQEVARWYAELQGDRVTLSENVRKKAAELTQGATTGAEKSRRLYDYVARNIRYVSLSFGVGRLQPHAANEVLQNGYGDCKDKHTLLQALLRTQGIESYPVLISSFRDLDPDVPSPAQFDHEITAVNTGGELTWLDSTAEVAPYGLIMYQLRNKQALLVSGTSAGGLRRTPASVPIKNSMVMKLDGRFTEAGAFDTKVDITAQGDSDLPLRAAFRSLPQARWQEVVKNFSAAWGLAGDVTEVRFDDLENTIKPFHLTYRFHKDNYFAVPNAGVSFRILPPMGLRQIPAITRNKASKPIDVGPAKEELYRAHIVFPTNYTLQVPSTATISRDYGEYTLSYSLTKNILEGERHVILKVNELPASRRSDFESFHNVVSSAVEPVLNASIRPPSAAALANAANTTGTPEELRKAANSAMQRRDFAAAADLFQRALGGDETLKNGWNDLGRAYAGLNQHDEAIRAFRKQLELDPFHATANQGLASELEQQGKVDEAIAAYRKQLDITPSSKQARKNLGLLLAQMNKDDDAKAELEAAASIPPEDPQVKLALARIYTRTGNAAKAEELMKSVTGASGSGSSTDVYASTLRDNIDPNQTLRDARKTLDDIGDQFDSGEYDRLEPSAFRSTDFIALAWARIGWARFLQGQNLEALQFLQSAWLLSQSGTVQNRIGRVYQKEGQLGKAAHAFALAIAAGGVEVELSRERLNKLLTAGDSIEKQLAQAASELAQLRTSKVSNAPTGIGTAQFALVFDGSNKPDRAEWLSGNADLRALGSHLRDQEYLVKFPDVSSVKIVRKATLSCDGSACTLSLAPLEGLQPEQQAASSVPVQKP